MPEEKKDGGRVVYHRLDGAEGEGHARAAGEAEAKDAAAGGGAAAVGRKSLWQAVVPLLLGFVMLIALVVGLGLLSDDKLEHISFETSTDERRLSSMFGTLLNLQLALNKLHTEARLRARVEAGTESVIQPPTDVRVRREREAVEELLKTYDALPLSDERKKLEVRRRVEAYIETTKDLESFSLRGFEMKRDLDSELSSLFTNITERRMELEQRRFNALRDARQEIRFLMWLAALTGLVVATATFLEVLRRFRQMRRGFEALRRERQFSAQMLEGMVSAIAAVGPDDRIRSANAAFFSVFPGARVGASVHDDFSTPEGMKLLASATGKRSDASAYHGRWRLADARDGEHERAFDVYSSPLEIEGGPGQLLTLVDVTEAAESEQELRRQESLAAVGQAAAQVAHEIKNPLGSIRLGVAMLRDMTKDREAINTIDLVERGIEHLSKLTLDVTQFSRRRLLTPVEVELHELLGESLDLVSDKLKEKGTPIEKLYGAEPLRAVWDEDQLRQVFVNLLANALDASPAGSPVTIQTERAEVRADPRHNGEGGRLVPGVRIRIADRGPGMDERTRARIFEPFFTTKKRGTGLGLAIAKQIVEQHGGIIRVESEPGSGTRFMIELPLTTEET
ncbi:MAG TPA: ATP-binding protein [Pyrinomonadaceae bacterium]|nr:ATP-binding protein [Pyrinomonadaceae bacterium]